MKKVWVILEDGTYLDAVFTTKNATIAYIKQNWPGGKLTTSEPTMLDYEYQYNYSIVAYLRYTNKPFNRKVER